MNKLKITVLGSVSPYPKGAMNCPGFLVENGKERILLDCGNGITRNLKFPEHLKNLSVIITHYHKDHFGDIGVVQYASYVYHNLGLLDKKIKIYLPKNDFGYNRKAILANKESYAEYIDLDENTELNYSDLKVSFENNRSHTIESFIVKLETPKSKVIYTSDVGIGNFEALEKLCQNANLLICESSFLIKHKSNCTTHLTAYQAGVLARRTNSKMLLLTHFWPEEDKADYLKEAKINFSNSFIAIENETYELP